MGLLRDSTSVYVRRFVLLHIVALTFILLLIVCFYQDYMALQSRTLNAQYAAIEAYAMDLDSTEHEQEKMLTSEGFYEWELTVLRLADKSDYYELFVTSIFLDLRYGDSHVRILGLQRNEKSVKSTASYTFQCVFNTDTGEEVRRAESQLISAPWPPDTPYVAVVYHCPAPSRSVDQVTFLVRNRVGSIILRLHDLDFTVIGDKGHDEEVMELGICVPAVYGKSVASSKLIEWVEHHKLLGVGLIALYDSGLEGPTAYHLLQYYRDTKTVVPVKFPLLRELKRSAAASLTVAGSATTGATARSLQQAVDKQMALVSLNDCLYRFQHAARYVLIAELDDFFMPSRDESLTFLMQRAHSAFPNASSFTFPTGWFFLDFNRNNILNDPLAGDSFFNYMGQKRTEISMKQPRVIVRVSPALVVDFNSVVSMHSRVAEVESVSGLLVTDHTVTGYFLRFARTCQETFEKMRCAQMKTSLEEDKYFKRHIRKVLEKVVRVKRLTRIT